MPIDSADQQLDTEGWKQLRKQNQNHAHNRLVRARETILRDFDWVRHSDYHYSLMIGEHRLDYWPSTSKIRFRNRTITGMGIAKVRKFIKSRQ